jgi:hypothetical protein
MIANSLAKIIFKIMNKISYHLEFFSLKTMMLLIPDQEKNFKIYLYAIALF